MPEEVCVEEDKDVGHDCTFGEKSTIEECMEAYNVYGNREDKECCKSCAICNDKENGNRENDGDQLGKVPSVHEYINECKCFGGVVKLWSWRWKKTECTKDRRKEEESQNNS